MDNTGFNKRTKDKSSKGKVVKSCKGCKLIDFCYRVEWDDYRCYELEKIKERCITGDYQLWLEA